MFEPFLTLPKNPKEAGLVADSLDALANALNEWPTEAWQNVKAPPQGAGLFERLVARTAPAAADPAQRARARQSALAVADVLRVLWPEPAMSEPREMLAAAAR